MNNIIIYTVSALIASMAASIIFLSAGTTRVFPVELFLSRDVALVSVMYIVSSICPSMFCWCCVCGLVGIDWPIALKMTILFKWLCPCIDDLLWAGYHLFRFRLHVLPYFWY